MYGMGLKPLVVKHTTSVLVTVQYGSQTVPITDDLERLLAFKPAKGMQLLGFVTNDPAAPLVPRHTFMSVRCRRGCQERATHLCRSQ